MRIILMLVFWLSSISLFAQPLTGVEDSNAGNKKYPFLFIKINSGNTKRAEPLLVVDGVPVEMQALNDLDPHAIESITILNEDFFIGCRRSGGVLLITTKRSRKLLIKDLQDGNKLPGATVEFSNGKHTIMAIANDSGMVMTNQLKQGDTYQVKITMTGYKKRVSVFRNSREPVQEIVLQRDTRDGRELILAAAYGKLLRCVGGCNGLITSCKIHANAKAPSFAEEVLTLYPNPAPKGETVTVKLKNESVVPLQVKIISSKGQELLLQSAKAIKDTRLFKLQTGAYWSSGIYIVQLINEKGKPAQSAKLLIQ